MKTIYHYTSIETLALILRNNTWRFSRLDKLDDQQEWKDLQFKLSKQIFVACFTYEENESIPQWKMYGGTKGIRISFSNEVPFKIIKIPSIDSTEYYSNLMLNEESFNAIMLDYNNFRFFPHYHSDGTILRDINFLEVEYDNYENVSLRKKDSIREVEGDVEINAKNILALKSNYWSFQNEVRLFVHIIPEVDTLIKAIDFECNLDYLDFRLDRLILKNSMSITLGPDCSDADRIIVESLLKANGIIPNGKVNDSFLKGKVKYK